MIILFYLRGIKLINDMENTIQELPMKCFRISLDNGKQFDVFVPDLADMSSIVNVTDENGDQVPYELWDTIGLVLESHFVNN